MTEHKLFCKRCDIGADADGQTDIQNNWVEMRYDFYGLATGYFCDNCYDNNYPYRKDAYYDEGYAGERMDDNY